MKFFSTLVCLAVATSSLAYPIPSSSPSIRAIPNNNAAVAFNKREGIIGGLLEALLPALEQLPASLQNEFHAIENLVPVPQLVTLLGVGAENLEAAVEQLVANAGQLKKREGIVGGLLEALLPALAQLPASLQNEFHAIENLVPVEDIAHLLTVGAENLAAAVEQLIANASQLKKREGIVGGLLEALLPALAQLPSELQNEFHAIENLVPVADLAKLLTDGAENLAAAVEQLVANAGQLKKREGIVGGLLEALLPALSNLPEQLKNEFAAIANLVPVKDLETLLTVGAENLAAAVEQLVANAGQL